MFIVHCNYYSVWAVGLKKVTIEEVTTSEHCLVMGLDMRYDIILYDMIVACNQLLPDPNHSSNVWLILYALM